MGIMVQQYILVHPSIFVQIIIKNKKELVFHRYNGEFLVCNLRTRQQQPKEGQMIKVPRSQ